MDESEYEAVDHGMSGPIPPPIKSADLMAAIRKHKSQDSPGKSLTLPPATKLRYSKNPVPLPPLMPGKKAPPYIEPRALPISAPPTISKKPPPPMKKKSDSLPKAVRSAPHDSNTHFGPPSSSSPLRRVPSPSILTPPPLPSSEGGDRHSLMLADLVRKHSRDLPLRVRVEEGFCGAEERFVISSGDIYNFHFVKNEKMVSVSDSGKNHFMVPYNSGIKFGLLYNPNDNFKEASQGYMFKCVADLVAAGTTPRMVRVLSGSPAHTSTTKSVIGKGDLLIIRKAAKTVLRKPFIKVYSFNMKAEKTLYDDCESSFSTDPGRLQLYIPEILEYFPDSYPLEAMMYAPGEDAEDLPAHLTTDCVSLTHTSIESVIIATTHWGEEEEGHDNIDDDEQMPVSIPIEMEIEVTILDDTDEDELYFDTRTLLQHLDFSKVKEVKDGRAGEAAGGGGGGGGVTKRSYRKARKGYEFKGVDITISQKVSEDPRVQSSVAFRSVLREPLPPPPNGLASVSPLPPAILSSQQTPTHKNHSTPKLVPPQLPPSRPDPAPFVPTRGISLDDSSPRMRTKSKTAIPLKKAKDDIYDNDDYVNDDDVPPSNSAPLVPRRTLPRAVTSPLTVDRDSYVHMESCVDSDPFSNSAPLVPKRSFLGGPTLIKAPLVEDDDYVNDSPPLSAPPLVLPSNPAPLLPRRSNQGTDTQPSEDYYVNDPPSLVPPTPPSNHASLPPRRSTTDAKAPPSSPTPTRRSLPGGTTVDTKDSVRLLRTLVESVEENSLRDMQALRAEVSSLTSALGRLKETCRTLQVQVEGLTARKGNLSPCSKQKFAVAAGVEIYTDLQKTMDPETQQENVANLKILAIEEVLCLLDTMKLSQYRELFLEESIDGEILAECDESLLEQELHITNKLHRSRLMKVITGRHSARNIQYGVDPYAGTVTRGNR